MLYVDFSFSIPENGYKKVQGNAIYYYLYTKHYRNEKGQPRHKSLQIGKITTNENGESVLIPNDNYFEHFGIEKPKGTNVRKAGRLHKTVNCNNEEPKYHNIEDGSVLGFGYGIAYLDIANKSGLKSILENVFGTELSLQILAIAAYYTLNSGGGLTGIEYFTSSQMMFTNSILSHNKALEIFRQISDADKKNFLQQWIKQTAIGKTVCYDVTSISSYSCWLDDVSYGYNRDKEDLPQVNLGMFTDLKTQVPIAYVEYDGSINDFSNIPAVLTYARMLSLEENGLSIVADGGFENSATINYLLEHKIDFILGTSYKKNKQVKEKLISWRKQSSTQAESFINDFDDSMEASSDSYITSSNTQLQLNMYYNSAKAALELTTLKRKIKDLKQVLDNKKTLTIKELSKFKTYFNIIHNEDDTFTYTLNQDAINESRLLCGCFALLTTHNITEISLSKCLELYKDKDTVEKAFDELKNEIEGERLYVHTNEAYRGKMFVLFISLIVYRYFKNNTRNWIKQNKSSMKAVFDMLAGIRCYKNKDKWYMRQAFVKGQKELIKILDLPVDYLVNSLK